MQSYHFSLGNSTNGPVGFCARVNGTSKADAVERLRTAIDGICAMHNVMADEDDIEYLEVYFNPDRITTRHIDEVGG